MQSVIHNKLNLKAWFALEDSWLVVESEKDPGSDPGDS